MSPPSKKPRVIVASASMSAEGPHDYLRTTQIKAFAITVVDDSQNDQKIPVSTPRPSVPLPSVGDVVGSHYRLVRLLGEGAFGKVYAAQRVDVPEHQVALKILPRSVYEGRNVERELVMLATVGHPNVVQLKDHGTGPSFVWLTMPIYEGETLAERLDRGPLTLREAYDIFLPLARGLEALHAAGLRHQDIKPENIFLAVFGGRLHPVLLDLGVAAEREATFVAGTLIYGSPEQIAAFKGEPGSIPLTEKMDTYGLGTTILVSLAGAPGFPGMFAAKTEEIAEAQQVRSRVPLREDVLPELRGRPRELLEGALRRWLALDPAVRPAMSELADDLDVLLEPEREEARAEELRRERQKVSMIRVRVTAIGMLVAAGVGALFLYSKRATLELAGQLEVARREGAERFDKLDMCVASHMLEKSAVSACKSEREKDRGECRATLDAMAKSGSSEHMKEIQSLEQLYTGRLRACEESDSSAQKACIDERTRLTNEWAEARTKLTTERDEQRKLAGERATAIEALTAQRDRCETERTACGTDRDQCRSSTSAAPAPVTTSQGPTPAGTSAPATSALAASTTQPASATATPKPAVTPAQANVNEPPRPPPPPPPASERDDPYGP